MLRELRTFIAVAQHGTFSSAAARIGLTQSAVSAQMQRLEEELGITLFDRTGRSAVLSHAGRETLGLAEEMMTLYARLGQHADAPNDSGMLRVGAIASAQTSFLVGTLSRFRVEMPGWRVRLMPGVSLNLLALVDAGDLDAAVIIRPPFALPAELEWCSLTMEPFVLLAPATPPARAPTPWRTLLKTAPFIRYDRASFGGRLVDKFLRRARITVNDVVELDELQAIVKLVACGVGVALLPLAADTALPDNVQALALGDDTFYREIGLVQPRQSKQAMARRFAELTLASASTGTSASA